MWVLCDNMVSVKFWRMMGRLGGSEEVEVKGFEGLLEGRWRWRELLREWICMRILVLVFLVGKGRSNENGAYHEVEDDEEESGSEPAADECPYGGGG